MEQGIMARLVSLGSASKDVFLIDRDDFAEIEVNGKSFFSHLELGQKVDIDRIAFSTGGGATNAAVTFARFGHESAVVSNIGNDSEGEDVLKDLKKEHVNTNFINTAKNQKTGYSTILLTPRGERTILTFRGASAHLQSLDANRLAEFPHDWLYATTLRGNFDILEAFFKKTQSLGGKVMFNPGKAELDNKRAFIHLASHMDALLLNKSEAQSIVPGETLTELLENLKKFVAIVIITDGSMGAIAHDGNKTFRIGLYEDVKVRDATGAGDAFGSGFLAAYASGETFKKSLHFAAANSTFVVTKIGAKAGILTGKEKLHPMPMQEIK
jgi:ribokinase